MRSDAHLVLWDGDCGFCGGAIAWLQRQDRQHRFQFVSYQEAPSPPMTPELYRACGEAVHVVDRQGSIRRGGRATLFILEQEGWGSIARVLSLPPVIWMVEPLYCVVATNRSLISRFFFRRISPNLLRNTTIVSAFFGSATILAPRFRPQIQALLRGKAALQELCKKATNPSKRRRR